MADFCLPQAQTQKVREAFKTGVINPNRLRKLTSAERYKELAKIVGDDLAKDVNARFEKNLLLKNQQNAMARWVNNMKGTTVERRQDMVNQIMNLRRVLDPVSEEAFLADLAAQKVGTAITSAEGAELVQLSLDANRAKTLLHKDPWNKALQKEFGDSYQLLTQRITELKDPGFRLPRSWSSWGEGVVNVGGLIKQLRSNFDFSAPLVQFASLISNKNFWTGLPEMLRHFADEKHYFDFNSSMIGHPYYEMAREARLGITEIDGRLLQREESFSTNILEKMAQYGIDFVNRETGVTLPNAPRAFNRAFTGYSNYVRWNTYLSMVDIAKVAGADVRAGTKIAEELASIVNNFSGRAGYGKTVESQSWFTGLLNVTFWAPRKMLATIQVLNPVYYAKLSPVARKIALKQLMATTAATVAIFGLVKATGGDVDIDPRSQSYGTITLPGGKYRYDLTGGSAIYQRFLARLLIGTVQQMGGLQDTDAMISTTGKGHKMGDPKFGGEYNVGGDVVAPYFRGKLSPMPSIFLSAMLDKTAINEEFDLGEQLLDNTTTPMTIQQYIDIANDSGQGAADILMLPMIALGTGVRMPYRPTSNGLNAFGEPEKLDVNEDTTFLYKSLKDSGIIPYPAPDTINSIKLTQKQHEEYVVKSGSVLKELMLPVVKDVEFWNSMTTQDRSQTFKDNQKIARKLVADAIIAESEGTDNDIRAKSDAKKEQGN